jgi:hypothetical protein
MEQVLPLPHPPAVETAGVAGLTRAKHQHPYWAAADHRMTNFAVASWHAEKLHQNIRGITTPDQYREKN